MSEDIVSAIDRAIGCQTCEGDLGGSVSDDFCSEMCQNRWHAGRVESLPAGLDFRDLMAAYAQPFRAAVEARAAVWSQSFAALAAAAQAVTTGVGVLGGILRAPQEQEASQARARAMGFTPQVVWLDEVDWDAVAAGFSESAVDERSPVDLRARALELRRNRNTGPASRARAPRSIEPRRSR